MSYKKAQRIHGITGVTLVLVKVMVHIISSTTKWHLCNNQGIRPSVGLWKGGPA